MSNLRLCFTPLMFVLLVPRITFGANPGSLCEGNSGNAIETDSVIAEPPRDSVKHSLDKSAQDRAMKRVEITVGPDEASDAAMTLTQKNKTAYDPSGMSTYQMVPDTIGHWNAPLHLRLGTGLFELKISKQGFREAVERFWVDERDTTRVFIQLVSFEYLRAKREQWNSFKWICSGVSVLAAGSALYFNNRVNTTMIRYDNAMSQDEIRDLRASVNRNRSAYKFSTGLAMVALGAFVTAWIIELTYQ